MSDWTAICHLAIRSAKPVILERGEDRRFFRATFRYLRLGAFEYWMMPTTLRLPDIPEGTILNRAKIPGGPA